MKCIQLLFVLAILNSASTFSQEKTTIKKTAPKLKFLVSVGFEFGGDSVADFLFQNGDEQSVNAGQGGSVAIGGELTFPTLEKFSLRATVGYKYVTTKATSHNITLTRIPIEFSANYYATKDLRLAAGFASHQNIKFNLDGLAANQVFSGGFGPKFEIAWRWVGLSYTIMDYKDSMNTTYNANSIGIILNINELF